MNSDDLTVPILDPAQLAELRRSTDPAPAAALEAVADCQP